MIHQLYIFSLIIITIIILIYYFMQDADYQREMIKINKIERRDNLAKQELELIRSQTVPCLVGDFQNPRSCFIDSGYSCSWNERAKRCDAR